MLTRAPTGAQKWKCASYTASRRSTRWTDPQTLCSEGVRNAKLEHWREPPLALRVVEAAGGRIAVQVESDATHRRQAKVGGDVPAAVAEQAGNSIMDTLKNAGFRKDCRRAGIF